MRELANRLERMGCINRDIRLAVAMAGPQSPQLAGLRADFSFECNLLVNQLTAMLAVPTQAQLASRLLDQFVLMRRSTAAYQKRWTISESERDPDGFDASTHEVNVGALNFIEDAFEAVTAAPTSPRASYAFAPGSDLRLTGTD
jgi:hypothetical protein